MSKECTHLGIDPGVSGGMVVIDPSGAVQLAAMPDTEERIWLWISGVVLHNGIDIKLMVAVEKVGGYMGPNRNDPTSKGTGNHAPATHMFEFGRSYGAVRMACIGNGLLIDDVIPAVWQKGIRCSRVKGESSTKFKTRLRDHARRLFPTVDPKLITKKTCDALLITEYHRRLTEHTL